MAQIPKGRLVKGSLQIEPICRTVPSTSLIAVNQLLKEEHREHLPCFSLLFLRCIWPTTHLGLHARHCENMEGSTCCFWTASLWGVKGPSED